jgi:hypothetical protein
MIQKERVPGLWGGSESTFYAETMSFPLPLSMHVYIVLYGGFIIELHYFVGSLLKLRQRWVQQPEINALLGDRNFVDHYQDRYDGSFISFCLCSSFHINHNGPILYYMCFLPTLHATCIEHYYSHCLFLSSHSISSHLIFIFRFVFHYGCVL